MSPRSDSPQGLSPEELEQELATDLPEREALSIVDPGVFSVLPTPTPQAADQSSAVDDQVVPPTGT